MGQHLTAVKEEDMCKIHGVVIHLRRIPNKMAVKRECMHDYMNIIIIVLEIYVLHVKKHYSGVYMVVLNM